jgi:hypothetical protein
MAEGCQRKCVGKKYTLCRPCAVAHVAGLGAFDSPCTSYERDSHFPLVLTCVTCGFDSADHPGAGTRQGLVVIAA